MSVTEPRTQDEDWLIVLAGFDEVTVRRSPEDRRRLTVEECARLQGFPEGHLFVGELDSRYRQVGNAVPPKVAEQVARAVRGTGSDLISSGT